MLRNLKPALIHRTLKPEKPILQADLLVLDDVVRASQRDHFPRVLYADRAQTNLQRAR